tara:strand:+ start:14 stop:376 length:363 start_codon:yes stop_codon:yes gene_type:complete
MSKYSEAAGLPYTTHESGVAGTTAPPVPPAPSVVDEPPRAEEEVAEVVSPPAPPVYENPLDDMPVATTAPVDLPSSADLKWMSKIKLEEIGRTVGIELDRRLSQPKLVEQLEAHIASMNG